MNYEGVFKFMVQIAEANAVGSLMETYSSKSTVVIVEKSQVSSWSTFLDFDLYAFFLS